MKRITAAIMQPCIPHYREAFFVGLQEHWDCDIYCLSDHQQSQASGFCISDQIRTLRIGYHCIWRFAFFNPFPLLRRKYQLLVLMASPWQMSNWFLMLLAPLLGKKVILWGQGVEVARYGQFEQRLPRLWRWMYRCASGAWFYTKIEQKLWHQELPSLHSAALGNTLETDKIAPKPIVNNEWLRKHYGITTPVNFLFCARINEQRRLDLLIKAIEALDPKRFGFIIIGDGPNKPDFSHYINVYNFGAVYDPAVKQELFGVADIYFQPAWLGLSVVEAMRYALPILTFSRTPDCLQGVEYGYIKQAECGVIVSEFDELLETIRKISLDDWRTMGLRGREYVLENLRMEQMVERAIDLWKLIK